MATPQAFLDHFEKTRLGIEERLLRLRESSELLARYGAGEGSQAQQYLHALPTVMGLLRLTAYAPRTTGALTDRFAKAGAPPSLNPSAVGRVLMCFGTAYLYRRTSKRTGDPQFAQDVTRIACISALGDDALEQVDWVVQSIARSRRGGSQDWLAPALLLVVWLTGMESTGKARWVAPFLDQLAAFVDEALDAALQNRIHMNFPW